MISIIITAYKEERTIARAIESILKNNLKQDYEVLVCAPDDETLNVAKEFSRKYPQVKTFKDKGEGKPVAMNSIFEIAKGEILIFTDGDVYVGENALLLMIEKFKEKKIGGVSGHPIPTNDKKTMLGFWGHLLFDIAHQRRQKAVKLNKRMFCSGYLYAFRKNIIKKIPTETLSEDGYISHLIYEAGYKIDYSSNSEVYVKYPTTFRDWIIQKKRSVGGYNQIKMWIGKEIRSFKKESLGIYGVLKYPKSIKEFFYTFMLIFARIYLWGVIFIDVNIKKKKLKEIWLRVGSTK